MKHTLALLTALLLAPLATHSADNAKLLDRQWVAAGSNGKLEYKTTPKGEGSIQPHMHWSTGLLMDSCTIPDGRIDLINRHSSGSGHGWAIVWNGTVKHLQIQIPPGALNLTIGCKGEPHKTHSKDSFFSANEPVIPASLYLAQLRERLGDAALKNIGY